jgi:3-oxoacyl-[acyl-carrier protein] reductase
VGVNYLKNQKGAEETVDAICKAGGEALAIRCDVTRRDEVHALVAAVRKQWGHIDILVNIAGDLIAPGVIATPYHERFSPPELMAKFVANIPLGRAGTSEEIADVILFLVSPAATDKLRVSASFVWTFNHSMTIHHQHNNSC